MITLALLAGALIGPDTSRAVRGEDYPARAIEKSLSAAALVRVLVDPKGRIAACDTLTVRGDAMLAREVCARLRRRTLDPAHFADGSPAWSQAVTVGRFYTPGGADSDEIARLGPEPDAELTVQRLPSGAASADVRVVLAVDEQGKAVDCAIDPRPPYGTTPALAAAVCANKTMLGTAAVSGPDGRPLRYVTPRTVRLVVKPAG